MGQVEEIQEAKRALDQAREDLARAKKAINSAKTAGILDLVGGGGLVSLFKRGKIKDFNKALGDLKVSLEDLQRELQDVQLDGPLDMSNSGFDLALDIFFDNVFTDFLVQRELDQKTKELDRLDDQLEDLDRALDQALKTL